jgi:AbrB family looped-hinge helix DNA binding protein
MTTTRLSSKGQVVIPREVRRRLGLKPGAELLVTTEGRKIVLEAVSTAADQWAQWEGLLVGTAALAEHTAEHKSETAKDE